MFHRQTPTRVPVPPSPGVEALTEEFASPSLSDILGNARKQYFQTLYIAKVSDRFELGVFVY